MYMYKTFFQIGMSSFDHNIDFLYITDYTPAPYR